MHCIILHHATEHNCKSDIQHTKSLILNFLWTDLHSESFCFADIDKKLQSVIYGHEER